MAGVCQECTRLYKDAKRLQEYIEDQSKRHSADMKALRESLNEEVKYSKKLRAELKEEYEYCERLRVKLIEKTRMVEDLRGDLEDERTYSEKLERKLDKRAKIIKDLESDLLGLEDDYAEARTALKRMDELRRQLDDAKLNRQYEQRRIKQLLEEVNSLRSTSSRTSSPYLIPAYTTTSPRYVPSPARASPAAQVHVLPRYASSSSTHLSPAAQPQALKPPSPPRTESPNIADQTPVVARRITIPPRSRTSEPESDYSEAESDLQDGRLTEDEEEELVQAEEDASEYSDAEELEVADLEDDKAPGQRLRDLAAREGRLADREYERAGDAHASGDKEFAKKLREAGAQHRLNMRNYHRMAAAEIFNHHNPEYDLNPSSRVKMDLHHLFVREAKEYVERHLDLCRRAKLQRTEIISGRGNHSIGGVAKIRPAIVELLETQRDVQIDERESGANPGRIVVRFLDVGRSENENSGDSSRSSSRSPSLPALTDRLQDAGPRHAEVEDIFEPGLGSGSGRTRLKATTHAAAGVHRDLEEIDRGINSIRLNGTSTIKSEREGRRGLRDVTNRKNG